MRSCLRRLNGKSNLVVNEPLLYSLACPEGCVPILTISAPPPSSGQNVVGILPAHKLLFKKTHSFSLCDALSEVPFQELRGLVI